MSKTIEITLDEQCASLITEEMATGNYASASELVHKAIQLLEKDKSLKHLENLIHVGEASGEAKDFSREKFIARKINTVLPIRSNESDIIPYKHLPPSAMG